MTCKECGGDMQAGKATGQTIVGGMPDFAGDTHPVTFSAGGPGKLIDCMKCVECGWSVTEPQLRPCPFCGGKARVVELSSYMAPWCITTMHKSTCIIGFIGSTKRYLSQEEAVAAWETRPPKEAG